MSMSSPRIALIHALELSVAPINDAFDRLWPEAERMNLLDDSLSVDRARDARLTDAMIARFIRLGRYAQHQARADAVLFTCSAFGPAIDAVAQDLEIPVHKPNRAMIARAVSQANGHPIALVASFEATLASMPAEFPAGANLRLIHATGALEAAQAGDADLHDRIVAAAAAKQTGDCAVLALSQFSLARAQARVAAATGKPVLVTPDCAVEALRADLADLAVRKPAS